jgi:hypothetical protein
LEDGLRQHERKRKDAHDARKGEEEEDAKSKEDCHHDASQSQDGRYLHLQRVNVEQTRMVGISEI